ncbi:cell division protein ZapE [Methylocella silvestris]|uniref:Cell division protein ZapE n=1 Tax=Methylocella silvestris TaxID=199596 RepID=A0A2J7TF49_METSI|nr:cell division protein ZapE [Methylocella silvestris]PNG25363.1 cell division protein ZapE [Methylocella silvestris]
MNVSVSLLTRYKARIDAGLIESDEAQRIVLAKLDKLRAALEGYEPATKPTGLSRFFGGRKPEPFVPGLYIWGSVGRGKTMLMDLFFEEAPPQRKRRSHFHAFMADVHAAIYAWRQDDKQKKAKGDDPIAAVADQIAEKAWLLCFDEFHVTDITDAMILGRLFTALFQRGVVIVATSNVEPINLYKEGLNRALFLPFIGLIQARMEIIELAARTDFRREKLEGRRTWHTPANEQAQAALTGAFEALTGAPHGKPMLLRVLGRALPVPEALAHVGRFSFADLCEAPLGPSDFLYIARYFHTVVIDDIPVIAAQRRDVAKRFITLIDTLYDEHVKLIASAAAEPANLYAGGNGREQFEFARTVSRLIEMRSAAYMDLPHGSIASVGSGDASGLVET